MPDGPVEKESDSQAQGGGDMRTLVRGGHLQDKVRGLRRSQGLCESSITVVNSWDSQLLREAPDKKGLFPGGRQHHHGKAALLVPANKQK